MALGSELTAVYWALLLAVLVASQAICLQAVVLCRAQLTEQNVFHNRLLLYRSAVGGRKP